MKLPVKCLIAPLEWNRAGGVPMVDVDPTMVPPVFFASFSDETKLAGEDAVTTVEWSLMPQVKRVGQPKAIYNTEYCQG